MIESIGILINLCSAIHKTHEDIKANREQALRLIERISLLGAALTPLKKVKKITPQLEGNLSSLEKLLLEVLTFIQHYSEKMTWFKRVFTAGSDAKQFETYITRLLGFVSQMNLSVNVDAFCYQQQDQVAAHSDHQLIQANRSAIMELNQIARYQFDALRKQGGEIEGVLKCGLYQLGDQVGAVKQAVTDFRVSLAKKDKRLNYKLDELQGSMHGLAGALGGLKMQAVQHQDVILLQLQSMQRHMVMMEERQQQEPSAVAAAAAKPDLDPALVIPLYEIELEAEPFAEGSFGTWYRGQYVQETVAVKLLPRFEDDDAKQFYREVKIMSQLRSTYIPQLFGASVTGEQAAIVMSYKEGCGLNHYLEQQETFSWEARSILMQDIAAVVAYLHAKEIVHRSLKSSNILVDAQGHASISDFGLALASQMSVKSIQVGSQAFSWMAPEYWQGKVQAPSDIYSLGVILLEIITGQPPIAVDASSVGEAVNQKRLTAIPKDCPEALATLITECLSMDPVKRPDAKTVAERLKLIEYRPPSPSGEELYQQGVVHQKAKKMEDAKQCFERSQGKGYYKAKTSMGLFHLQGLGGCIENKTEAHDLFLQAAKQEHVRAMINLVNMYGYGDGVAQDYKAAYEWAKKAWDAGEPSAEKLYRKFKTRYEAQQSQVKPCAAFSAG